jgi:TRAP-type C4-dicarboxylate transport system permease large subunit
MSRNRTGTADSIPVFHLQHDLRHRQGCADRACSELGRTSHGSENALCGRSVPIIIIGGIFGGIFSPTEATAVNVLYALFLETIVFPLDHYCRLLRHR